MNLVSCEKHTADLAEKQDKLLDCNGAPLAAGTRMATCDDIPTVSTYLGTGQNTSLSGTGTEDDPFRVGVATAGDALPGIVQLAVAANFPSASDTEAATPAYVAAAIAALPDDPVSTMAIVGVDYVHTDELGTQTTLEPSQFLSADPDNAAGVGTDGRIKVTVPGQATDTQNGTVTLAVGTNYPANATSNLEAATPAYVAAALDDAGNLVAGTNTTVTGTGTTADPFKVNTPATTLVVDGVNYKFTNEPGASTVIQPGQFLSPDAGNAIGLDANGRLKVLIPAQLPDDQVFTGDNSGTVSLTLTPVEVGDPALGTAQTNYTIKADLKLAAETPSGAPNWLKLGPSGFYVEMVGVFCD